MTASQRAFPGLGAALLVLAGALVAQVAAAFLWSLAWGGNPDLTLLTAVGNLTALSAVLALGYWKSGQGPEFRPPVPVSPWLGVGLVLSAVGGTVVLGELANWTTWLVPLPAELARLFNQLTEGNPVYSLLALSVVAPLTEEALFRGLLLRGFARRYGFWPGLLLSSALFALFHLNVWQAATAFVAGLYLGWLYLSTRSLLFPMAAHALFNGLPVFLAFLGWTVEGYNTPMGDGAVVFQPLPWVLGGLVVLVLGLWLTKRWTPLSPDPVSDTVAP